MAYKSDEERRAKQRAYYLANREKVKARSRDWRKTNPERAAAKDREWQERRRDHVKQQKAAYYRANAETFKAKARAHHHATYVHKPRPAPLPRKVYLAQWREKNRLRLRQKTKARYKLKRVELLAYYKDYRDKNRAAWLVWSRAYRKANQHKRNADGAKRRAAKQNAPIGERPLIVTFYKWIRTAPVVFCHHCGQPVPKGKRHVDHLVPLSANGPHAISNLVPSCETCNCRKGPRPASSVACRL